MDRSQLQDEFKKKTESHVRELKRKIAVLATGGKKQTKGQGSSEADLLVQEAMASIEKCAIDMATASCRL